MQSDGGKDIFLSKRARTGIFLIIILLIAYFSIATVGFFYTDLLERLKNWMLFGFLLGFVVIGLYIVSMSLDLYEDREFGENSKEPLYKLDQEER